MLRERVSPDIFIFTSELYAQVTAIAIATREGAILIDTLAFPAEAQEMKGFVERVCPAGVRYVILTHYHADHTYGAYLYPQADVVAHALYAPLQNRAGAPALELARAQEPALQEVQLRMPDITFEDGELGLRLGGKSLRLIHAPGHTADSLMVYLEEEHILFAADVVLPTPSIADGDIDALRASLRKTLELPVENLVQGHGEIILRGEVQAIVQSSLDYLDAIEEKAAKAAKHHNRRSLEDNNIESCGLSRIPLNGMVQYIHTANLLRLYDEYVKRNA